MAEVCLEIVGAQVVVYRPGSTVAIAVVPTLEDALALARAEWPDFGIKVIYSRDVRDCLAPASPWCASIV